MKKNILISHIHMRTGGIESTLFNLLSSLDENKYDVDLVLFYPDGTFMDKLPKWINIIPIWDVNKKSMFLKKLVLSRNIIARIIKNLVFNKFLIKLLTPKKHYDVSIAYSGYFKASDYIAALSNANKKFIWVHADFYTQYQIDETFRNKFKQIYKRYKYFDKIVCVSQKASENLKLLRPELSDKIVYQWNINKERKFNDNNINNVILNGHYNIVSIGRLAAYKGFERLLDLASLMKKNNISFHIYVLGDGPKMKELNDKIQLLDLSEFVFLLGNVTDVFSVLRQADLYVLPSDCEGFPSVILESLIAGIPVISTPTSGSIDIFKNFAPSHSMLLSKEFSPESLFECVTLAMQNALSKDFIFNIEDLNKNILQDFEKLIY